MIYLESLAMAHKDDKSLGKHCALAKVFATDPVSYMHVVHALCLGSVGTQAQCIEVITHLERIIVAKSSVLIKLNKNRRVPR